ncbi:MAG TPA: pitrilysin family protein, partial [Vicinamibacterales bacterium]
MTRSKAGRIKVCVLAVIAVCAVGIGLRAQAPDRSKPPVAGPPPELRLPPIEKRQLSNGVPVWIVQLHEVPVAQVNLLLRSGGADDPQRRFGLANMTAAMLEQGAGSRTALQIADEIDFLGADLSAVSGMDSSVVRLHVPVARLGDALPVMADVVLRPAFPSEELDRVRQERLTAILQARDDPPAIASAAFARVLFGVNHRYGTPAAGTAEVIKTFAPGDLKEYYTRAYRPDNATLIVVGDTTPDRVLPQLESAFGTWKAPSGAITHAPMTPGQQPSARTIYLIDKPGAPQSQIRIGGIGVSRSTPDFFPIQIVNTILGGSFTSRLNNNLREVHGYAYGAGSSFDMRVGGGL